MYQHRLYLIENHTHMHVGSGEANFGTVDRLIQRDAVTGYPVIHSSSLKGALKEYCEHHPFSQEAPAWIRHTFGDETQAGKVRFFDAWLIAVPMRANTRPYFACTSPAALRHLLEMAELAGIELIDKEALKKAAAYSGQHIAVSEGKAVIEGYEAKAQEGIDFDALARYTGDPCALVPDSLFEELLKDLPVIARNQLDNGESKNLWYEEVLPRKSRLFTLTAFPTHINAQDEDLHKHFDRLRQALLDEHPVQIGANASVGYGLCTFREVAHA